MKGKALVGGIVVVIGLVLGAMNFFEANVEYMDFAAAEKSGKKAQVKGEWIRELESGFDHAKAQFHFYMKDDRDRIAEVVLDGAMPNNFEIATSIVAKGRFEGGRFHASEVLTKCPSKYEGTAETVKKTL
jgi:cytochrome c-type biogenesis protein CcmE